MKAEGLELGRPEQFAVTKIVAFAGALLFASHAASGFATAPESATERYPARPVRSIVPFPPGGSDVPARVLAQKLTEKSGHTTNDSDWPCLKFGQSIEAPHETKVFAGCAPFFHRLIHRNSGEIFVTAPRFRIKQN
jgi:hypothetical protein